MKLILIFIDGIGMGQDNPYINPFSNSKKSYFRVFDNNDLGQPIPYNGYAKGLDATLGIEGLPQSATGQTSIFTGLNAAQALGKHLSGFPNSKLKGLIKKASLLKILKENNLKVMFANTYRPSFKENNHPISCTTVAAQAAGLSLNGINELRREKSICHDLTNACFPQSGYEAPLFSPQQSAHILVQLAEKHHFTLFEYFLTDVAGHAQNMALARILLFELELFLETLLQEIQKKEIGLMIISDHGNFEDLSTKSHTLNPSLFLCWGELAQNWIRQCQTIMDPYHAILNDFKIARVNY